MPIRVSCRHCGKQFSAWDDLVGKTAQCPKCKGRMIVPGGSATRGSSEMASDDDGANDLPSLDEMVSELPADGGGSGELPSLDYLLDEPPTLDSAQPPATRKPDAASPPPKPHAPDPARQAPTRAAPSRPATKTSAPTKASPPAPPAASPPRARGPGSGRVVPPPVQRVDEFDDSDELPVVCPNCSQPLPGDEDLCDACGYHRILKKVLDMDGIHRRERSTGLERVLKQQLSENETIESVLLWGKIVAGLLVLILVGFIGMCMGPLAALICLVAVGGLVFWMVKQARRDSDSTVERDPLSAGLWNGLLTLQRACGWRLLEWPFPRTRVLTMHDPGFSDDDLAQLENLDSFQTLDLQSSQITDHGLVHLEEMKQLRFLVLRETRVTAEGVRRLQRRLDKAMIWH